MDIAPKFPSRNTSIQAVRLGTLGLQATHSQGATVCHADAFQNLGMFPNPNMIANRNRGLFLIHRFIVLVIDNMPVGSPDLCMGCKHTIIANMDEKPVAHAMEKSSIRCVVVSYTDFTTISFNSYFNMTQPSSMTTRFPFPRIVILLPARKEDPFSCMVLSFPLF